MVLRSKGWPASFAQSQIRRILSFAITWSLLQPFSLALQPTNCSQPLQCESNQGQPKVVAVPIKLYLHKWATASFGLASLVHQSGVPDRLQLAGFYSRRLQDVLRCEGLSPSTFKWFHLPEELCCLPSGC